MIYKSWLTIIHKGSGTADILTEEERSSAISPPKSKSGDLGTDNGGTHPYLVDRSYQGSVQERVLCAVNLQGSLRYLLPPGGEKKRAAVPLHVIAYK